MATEMFVIFAADRSFDSDEIVWWGPGESGYTKSLDRAGRYTKAEAERLQYAEPGDETIPVPLDLAEASAVRVVPKEAPIVSFINNRIRELRQVKEPAP